MTEVEIAQPTAMEAGIYSQPSILISALSSARFIAAMRRTWFDPPLVFGPVH
jgi:hypothetical protein